MTKFIKLREPTGNNEFKHVLVNVDRIEYCCKGNKNKDTYLKIIGEAKEGTKGAFFFVLESLEQIEKLISIDTTKAPIIMTAEEAVEYYREK